MKSTVVAEHRALEAVFEEARVALARGDADSSRRALATLEAALAAHFEQEDRLYYPAIATLRNEHASALRSFAAGHTRFLAQLERVAGKAREGAFAEGRAEFDAFTVAFAAHEVAEEELLRSLDEGVATSR